MNGQADVCQRPRFFDDICSMEQQTDCKKPSNYSRPDFAHFAKKVLLMRTIFPIAGGLSVLLIAFGAQSSNPSAPTQRVPQIENSHVKVWKSTITPNAPLPLHRHDHGRVIVALQGGTMKIVDKSGTSETHVWETGKAYWLPKNPPNTMRSDVNAGDRPISACSAKRPALQDAPICNDRSSRIIQIHLPLIADFLGRILVRRRTRPTC
jgi:beta-alanine degradation protein BauB